MAQKRMFDKSITNSDDFLDLPDSSQILYFHLSMNADDDGFVNNWKSIIRMTGTKEDDLKILIAKQFVIPFESGVIVIKHWRINNYLRNDRYKETQYKDELACLITGKNEEYLLKNTSGIPTVYPDKNSIDKNSIDKDSKEREVAHTRSEYGWVKLTDQQYNKLLQDLGEEELKRCIQYVDEAAQQTGNKNKWKDWNLVIRKCSRGRWGINQADQPQKKKQFTTAEKYEPPHKSIDVDAFNKLNAMYGGINEIQPE